MLDKVIVIYAIIDDILKAIGHFDDCRRQMSDAEILTTALVAALFFYGNHAYACKYMQEHGLVGQMLGKSRFSRRLHQLSDLVYELFHQLGMTFKHLHSTTEYLLDSFPVPICDNIRIRRCRLMQSKEYRGYISSKRRYFYGVRVHLLATRSGIPVEFIFLPGSAHDLRGLHALPLALPAGSEIYADKAYTDYQVEDHLQLLEEIHLQAIRKKNSRRPDAPWVQFYKQSTRHQIETVFSQITQRFPKSIHAVTMKGFLLKLSTFIFAFTLEQAFL